MDEGEQLSETGRTPGSVLRALRERAGISAYELAARAKISESYLAKVETGATIPADVWLGHVTAVLVDEMIARGRAR